MMHLHFRRLSRAILSGAFALCIVGGANADEKKPDAAPATKPAAAKKLTLEEFEKARQAKGVIVLDVRSSTEFAHGHVAGAISVPISGPGSEDFEKRVSGIQRDKP